MGLVEQVAAVLGQGPVGRVYLEEVGGQRVQVLQTSRVREPQIRWQGKVYAASHQVAEGWVYRTWDEGRPGVGSDETLTAVCGPNDPGFVWPSDWPAKPDPEGDAVTACSAAITALGRFAGQAGRFERLMAAWEGHADQRPAL